MSSLFGRICIGTANFGSEYNGVKVSEKDIEKILGYCQCSGIDTLDTATAYGWDWTQANSYFNKIIKVQEDDDIDQIREEFDPYAIISHKGIRGYFGQEDKLEGLSVYSPNECNFMSHQWPKIIELPYSLYDRRFDAIIEERNSEIHVRSIFLRGRILEDGIEPCECIKFCLCNPYIDKVIIGVDSLEQLQRNLDFLFRWKNLERHDEELLDTRKW